MKRHIFALLVCLPLLLSACGKTDAGAGGLLSRASGIADDEVLLTVDGREVPAWRYLYWLTAVCDQIRTAWNDAGRTLDWQQTLSGEPLADYARRKALENTALYATVETLAEENGVTLTEDDQAQLDGEWQEKVAEYGGEEAYLQALERMGLGREEAQALSEDACLYRKLLERSGDASSGLYVTPEETAEFAAGREYLAASCILVSTAGVAAEDSEALADKRAGQRASSPRSTARQTGRLSSPVWPRRKTMPRPSPVPLPPGTVRCPRRRKRLCGPCRWASGAAWWRPRRAIICCCARRWMMPPSGPTALTAGS